MMILSGFRSAREIHERHFSPIGEGAYLYIHNREKGTEEAQHILMVKVLGENYYLR